MATKKQQRGFREVRKDFKKHEEKTQLPVRATKNSAGYDIFSKEDYVLAPNQTRIFFTDVKAFMLPDEVLMLYVRSSIGIKKGLMLANTVGVIDSDYYNNPDNDGNIGVALHNYSKKPVVIKKGDKIAQCIFTKFLLTDNDQPTQKERKGGIGSTGN